MLRLLILALVLAAAVLADPTQPHLAQAWTAMSSGDGMPGQVGFESYLFEEQSSDKVGIRAHIWDYNAQGIACKKIEFESNDRHALQGTFYLKCDSVDCCFSGVDGHGGSNPARPDVKQWDIAQKGVGKKVAYIGSHDIQDLDGDVPAAETWFEKDHIPFTKVGVNYTYYITRNGTDIISHKIHYEAPSVSPGDILYGNFTVIHANELDAFRKTFTIPDVCYPQGSHKGHALNCDGEKVKQWERTHFKHSAAAKGYFAQPVEKTNTVAPAAPNGTCSIQLEQGMRFHAHSEAQTTRGLTQEECCAKCEADASCKGFAYEQRDLRDLFNSRCELHTAESGFGGKINSTHWVCGKK